MNETRRYRYKGDEEFARAAAIQLGCEIAPAELRGLKPYNVLTSLVSQAGEWDDPSAARSILAEARKKVALLRVAALAAAMIIDDADAAFAVPPEAAPVVPVVPVVPAEPVDGESEGEGEGDGESEAEGEDEPPEASAEIPQSSDATGAPVVAPKSRRGRKPKTPAEPGG